MIWDFRKDGRELRVRVKGRVVFNAVGHDAAGGIGGAWSGVPA